MGLKTRYCIYSARCSARRSTARAPRLHTDAYSGYEGEHIGYSDGYKGGKRSPFDGSSASIGYEGEHIGYIDGYKGGGYVDEYTTPQWRLGASRASWRRSRRSGR